MAPNILQKDGTKVGTNDPVTLHTTHNTWNQTIFVLYSIQLMTRSTSKYNKDH